MKRLFQVRDGGVPAWQVLAKRSESRVAYAVGQSSTLTTKCDAQGRVTACASLSRYEDRHRAPPSAPQKQAVRS